MAVIEKDVVVAGKVEDVFDYMANFESVEEWDPGVARASRRGPGPAGEGTLYDVEVLFNGKRMPMVYEVTEWLRPDRVVLRGTGSRVVAVDEMSFVEEGGGTVRIRYRADIRLRGWMAPLTPLLGKKLAAVGDAAAEGIRRTFTGRS